MPSPRGTNREQLYILKGERRSNPRGAYDVKGGFRRGAYDGDDDIDPVSEICRWVNEHLSPEDQSRLMEALAAKPFRAMDDDDGAAHPSLDPTQTKRIAPGQAKAKAAMDAIVADVLAKQFPGIEKIDVQPMQTSPRKSVVATDSARLKSLGERYPGFDRIGFA